MENTNLQTTDPDFTKKTELISQSPKLYSRKPKTVGAMFYCYANQSVIPGFLGARFIKFAWVDENGEPCDYSSMSKDSKLAVFFKMPMGQQTDIEVSAIAEEDVLVKDENGVIVPMHWTEFVEEFQNYKPTKTEAVQFGTTAEHLTAIRNLLGRDIEIEGSGDSVKGIIHTTKGTLGVILSQYIVKNNNAVAVIHGEDFRKWRNGELDDVVYFPLEVSDEVKTTRGFPDNSPDWVAEKFPIHKSLI